MTERDPNATPTPASTDPATRGIESAECRENGDKPANSTASELDGHGIVSHDRLVDRVDAIERAIAGDGDGSVADLSERAALEGRLSDLESAVKTVEDRIDEIDAATQAVRGYVGSIRAVNREVESRADLALATAERVERRFRPAAGHDSSVEARNPPARTGGRTDGGRIASGCAERDERVRRQSQDRGGETSDGSRSDRTTSEPDRECGDRRRRERTADRPPAVAAAIPNGPNGTIPEKIARAPDVAKSDPDVDSGILAKLRNTL